MSEIVFPKITDVDDIPILNHCILDDENYDCDSNIKCSECIFMYKNYKSFQESLKE